MRTAEQIAAGLDNGTLDSLILGMGCFWGPDSRLAALDGVVQTRVGYAGGEQLEPTYRSLGGHAEVVRIVFDREQLRFDSLFGVFRNWFTPTKANMMARRSQYRPVVFTNAEHKSVVAAFVNAFEEAQRPQIDYDGRFWSAEAYHQKYRLRQASPALVDALQHEYGARWDESELATKCNAIEPRLLASGQVESVLQQLSPQARARFRA